MNFILKTQFTIINNLSFNALKEQTEKIKAQNQAGEQKITHLEQAKTQLEQLGQESLTAINKANEKINRLKENLKQQKTQTTSQKETITNLQEALVEEEKHRQRNYESAKAGEEKVKEISTELQLAQEKIKELEETSKGSLTAEEKELFKDVKDVANYLFEYSYRDKEYKTKRLLNFLMKYGFVDFDEEKKDQVKAILTDDGVERCNIIKKRKNIYIYGWLREKERIEVDEYLDIVLFFKDFEDDWELNEGVFWDRRENYPNSEQYEYILAKLFKYWIWSFLNHERIKKISEREKELKSRERKLTNTLNEQKEFYLEKEKGLGDQIKNLKLQLTQLEQTKTTELKNFKEQVKAKLTQIKETHQKIVQVYQV